MQTAKKLCMFMAIQLLSVSVAFAAMTPAQIKQKFEEGFSGQGLSVCEVREMAVISEASLDDVFAAAKTATLPDGLSVDQLIAQIEACADSDDAGEESVFEEPVFDEPPKNECDTSVSPAVGSNCP